MKRLFVILLFLVSLASQGQVLKFMGRYDVSRVDSINDSTFRLSGEFVDLTGSYTALDADTNDKIIIRGYNSDGKVVYDRFKITGIDARNTSNLEVFVQSDFPAGVQNMTGWPGTGSFPIASPTADTSLLTYRPSMYMNGIDPDYDAALDNLNIQYASGSIADGFWNLDGQDIENMNAGYVGIGKKPATMLDVDGVITATGGNSTQWNDAYGWGDHSLSGYLTGSHQHNWSALIDPPATYTPTTHTHAEYLTAETDPVWSSEKSGYSLTSHNHTGVYQPVGSYLTSESDPVWSSEKSSYSLTSHNHTGVYQPVGSYLTSESDPVWSSEKGSYSLTSHNHSLSGLTEKSYNSLSDKPDLSSLHSHGNITALNNVSGVNTGDQDLSGYSLTSHNHNASYEPIISKSTGYAKWNGSAWTFLNETYSLSSHNHSGVYQPAGSYLTSESDPVWTSEKASYSLTSHNHSGVYQPVGSYLTTETDPVWSSEKSGYSTTSHNHDGSYSAIGHNHSGVYQPVGSYLTSETDPIWSSEKSGYSTTSHNHSLANLTEKSYNSLTDKPSTFPPSSHTHDDRYYTETEIGNFFSGGTAIPGYNKSTWDALVSFPGFGTSGTTAAYGNHNHSGVYQPAGSYLTSESDPVWSSEKSGYSTTSHNHTGVYDPSGTASGLMSTHNSTYNHGNIATVYGWGNHAGLYPLIGDSNKTSAGNYITRKYLSDNYALTSHNHTGVYQPVGSYLTSESDPVWSSEKSGYSTTSHNHSLANLTEKSYNSLTDKPSTFPPSSHTHDDRYYTETEIGNFFSGSTAITGYNKSTWDALVSFPGFGTSGSTAAYGNHNHSGVYQPVGSYLTSETDPVWTSEKSGYSQTGHTHNYVSSVGGTSPLQSSGGYTPTISFIGDSLTLWYQKMNKGVSAYNWGDHSIAGYAASSHNHDGSYSAIGHNHSLSGLSEKSYNSLTDKPDLSAYSLTSHNHTGTYEPVISKSEGYAKWTGSAWSFVNETYSLSSHNHSGVYQPAGSYLTSESDPVWSSEKSGYSQTGHTHSYVSSVGASSPLQSSGGTTPSLSFVADSLALWYQKMNKGVSAYNWGNHASAGYITSQPWSANGSKIYYNSGYVGIGNSNPAAPFEVNQNLNGTAVSVLNLAIGAVGITTYGYYSGLQASSSNGPAIYSTTDGGQALETHGEVRMYGLPSTSSFDSMAVKKASDNSKIYWASASGLTYSSGTSSYFPVFTGTSSLGNSYLTGNNGANILSSAYLTNRFGYNSGGNPTLQMFNGSTTEVFKVESTGDVTIGGNLYLAPEPVSGEVDSAWTKETPTSNKMVYRKLQRFNDSLKLTRITTSTNSQNELLAHRITLDNQGDYTTLKVGLKKGDMIDDTASSHMLFYDILGSGNEKQSLIQFNVGRHQNTPITMMELFNSDLTNYIKLPHLARSSGNADSAIWQDPSTGKISVRKVGGISGTVTVSQGGTGVTSLSPYGIMIGGTTATGTVQSVGTGSDGQHLRSNGSSAAPSWEYPVVRGTFCDLLTNETFDSIARFDISGGFIGGAIKYTVVVAATGESSTVYQVLTATANYVGRNDETGFGMTFNIDTEVKNLSSGTLTVDWNTDKWGDNVTLTCAVTSSLTPDNIYIYYNFIPNIGQPEIINPNGCD